MPSLYPLTHTYTPAITYPAEFAKTRSQLNRRLADSKKLPWYSYLPIALVVSAVTDFLDQAKIWKGVVCRLYNSRDREFGQGGSSYV